MVCKEMHRWICNYVLVTCMDSDRNRMAAELRISERMLDRALKRDGSSEARLVFELCMKYCVEHDININEVFADYFRNDD